MEIILDFLIGNGDKILAAQEWLSVVETQTIIILGLIGFIIYSRYQQKEAQEKTDNYIIELKNEVRRLTIKLDLREAEDREFRQDIANKTRELLNRSIENAN